MHREDWMLPREGVIGRSLSQQPTGWTAERRRKAKRAMMLLACATAALTLVSAAVLLSPGDGGEESTPAPEIPGRSAENPPGTPYPVGGYTYASDGVSLLYGVSVTVTNVNTEYSWEATSSMTSGFYAVVIYATEGDLIHAEGVLGELFGMSEEYAAGSSLQLDITLDMVIPEFPVVMLPVVGVVALLVIRP